MVPRGSPCYCTNLVAKYKRRNSRVSLLQLIHKSACLLLHVFAVAMQKMLSDSYAMSLLQEASDCRRRNLVSKAYMRLSIHKHT